MLNLISKSNLTFTSNKDCGCDNKKVSKSKNTNITNIKLRSKKLKNRKKTIKYSRKHF